MSLRCFSLLLACGLALLLPTGTRWAVAQESSDEAPGSATFSDEQVKFFEKEVRPLLVARCTKCHGAKKQQGHLRLDSREAILAGGDLGAAAKPGEPESSLLVEMIGYAGDLKMPPDGKLSQGEIATIVRWVREGLAWPAGDVGPGDASKKNDAATDPRPVPWSFVPVSEVAPPVVANEAWCISPVDRFVLARLEQAGLQPAPTSDRRTLVRRAKFDLVGLPPTPEEVEEFITDDAPDAFARLIDRFLAMPEYGQRWGRHWLDVARYADSNGQDENLAYVNAYRYRDYVVDAFNRDKPYDEFVREQIAGDLLPADVDDGQRFEHWVATGFLTLGPKMLAEDDPVKMEMDIVDEQLDTVGGAFLGMTLGCARCHDHKFDPISTADYYALAGIFKSTRTMDNFKVVAQWHERPLASAAELSARGEHAARRDAKKQELAAVTERANSALLAAVRTRLGDYLMAATELLQSPPLDSTVERTSRNGVSLPPGSVLREAESFDRGNVLIDTTGYGAGIGVILNRGELPNFVEYDIELAQTGFYQFEVRYAAAESRPARVLINGEARKSGAASQVTGSWNADSQRWFVEGVFELPAGKTVLRLERADGPISHFDKVALVPRGEAADDGALAVPRSAEELAQERGLVAPFVAQWASYLREAKKNPESIWQTWFAWREHEAQVAAPTVGVGSSVAERLLKAGQPSDAAQLAARYQAAIDEAERRGPESHDAADMALRSVVVDPQGPLRLPAEIRAHYAAGEREELTRLEAELADLEKSAPPVPPLAMAVEEGTPTDLPIHIRGSHLTLGDVVPRGIPGVFQLASAELPASASGRLELADWIADPRNPLTARVMVNRLWRWHFGAGIVQSTDNFGNLGEAPSHPELLDWLAAEFVRSGWSVKRMHRLMMLSSSYQMSTAYDASSAEFDPDNRLLWRMNRRRLEAEAVRDSLLFVGGGLDTSLGGSLLQSKPREYVTNTTSVNATNYKTTRRSLYLPVVRSAVYEALQAFDFAEPTVLKGDRHATTVAAQALFMMNSDLVEEQSMKLVARITEEAGVAGERRIRRLYEIALGRAPSDKETARALQFVERYRASVAEDTAPAEAAAWQALCRVVVSSNEFLYVD